MAIYEYIKCDDHDFPVQYHLDKIKHNKTVSLHWHENIELLYCISGEATVHCDTKKCQMTEGSLIVVNSNHFHSIYTSSECSYYCIIIDKRIFESVNLPVEEVLIEDHVVDAEIGRLYLEIVNEIDNASPYYKIAVKLKLLNIFTLLYRNYSISKEQKNVTDARVDIVKKSISYMRHNYQRKITIEDICENIGFSKYYVCHVFKEITGRSLIDYLNFLRCSHAYNLISTGKYNTSEAASLSGFSNDSYFGRTYKKYIGTTPSKAKPKT